MRVGSIYLDLKRKLCVLAIVACVMPVLAQAKSEQLPVQKALKFTIKPAQLSIHHTAHPELRTTLNWLGVKQGKEFVKPSLINTTQGKNHTEFKRAELTEWYKTLDGKLEHGITLVNDRYAQLITSDHQASVKKIQLRFELMSPQLLWRADTAQTTRLLGFKGDRSILEYGNLVAFDSNGKQLESSMAIHPKHHSTLVDIDVDVTNAQYPVVIDPLFASDTSQEITPANLKKDDYFARSFASATAGNHHWLFVGSAPAVRSVNPANSANQSNTPVVNGVDSPVRVFKQVQQAGGFTWIKHSDIPAVSDSISTHTQFGYAIAQWDEWLAVSAPDYQKNIQFSDGITRPAQQGAVHFYKFDANQNNGSGEWVLHQTLTYPFVAVADAKMGVRMTFENGVLALSAPFEGNNVGRVLLVVKDAQDHWAYVGASGSTPFYGLTASNDTRCNRDLFGASLAMYGDYLIVGRPLAVEGCNTQNKGLLTGAAHVFKKQNTGNSAGQWVETQVLYPPNKSSAQGDAFGHSVAINKDHLLVGAIYAKNKQRVTTGVVYPYELTSNGLWVLRSNPTSSAIGQVIAPENGKDSMAFGFSLALNDHDVLIGATGSGWSGYDGLSGQDVNADRVGEVHVYAFNNGVWQNHQVIPSWAKTIRGQLFGMTLGWIKNQKIPLIGSPLAVNKNNVKSGYLQQYKKADDVALSRIQVSQAALSSMVENALFDMTLTITNNAPFDDSTTHEFFIKTNGLPITLTGAPADFLCNLTQQNGRYVCQLPVLNAGSSKQARFEFKVGAFTAQMNQSIEFFIQPSANQTMVNSSGLNIGRNVTLNHPPQPQLLGAGTIQADYNTLGTTIVPLTQIKVTDLDNAQTFCVIPTQNTAFTCKQMGLNTFGLSVDSNKLSALKNTNDVYMRFSDGVDLVTQKVTVNVANVPVTAANSAPSSAGKASFNVFELFFLLLVVMASYVRFENKRYEFNRYD